jgi:3',5'-cyclic AMP phosphodiesterase CpdA
VLGNHDMDGGFSREQAVAFFGMPARYYSFDRNGWHFVVLDTNDPEKPRRPGYPISIGPDQLDWLRKDLAATDGPTILFSHAPLIGPSGGTVRNGPQVRALLEEINVQAGRPKIVASLNGHTHLDYDVRINGIRYIHFNSMSYYWVGGDYLRVRYGEDIDRRYPYIKYTAPYKDAVYAIVTLTPDGRLSIRGVESEWVGPSPQQLGYPLAPPYGAGVRPGIASRVLVPAGCD